eukprot:SAG22_NODE_696_length_7828_cov_35.057964_3_plen_124_part_00
MSAVGLAGGRRFSLDGLPLAHRLLLVHAGFYDNAEAAAAGPWAGGFTLAERLQNKGGGDGAIAASAAAWLPPGIRPRRRRLAAALLHSMVEEAAGEQSVELRLEELVEAARLLVMHGVLTVVS